MNLKRMRVMSALMLGSVVATGTGTDVTATVVVTSDVDVDVASVEDDVVPHTGHMPSIASKYVLHAEHM
jgi:hypothetical protein